ncbi:centriolin-like [Lytechinus pictus]|uniref:centriolin-like n=1 Tax=Lytechinus pictus TaxID=7653 RepID=UPI0030BA2052
MRLEEESKHAIRMSKEVENWKQEYLITKQQLHTHEEVIDQEKKLDSQLQHLKEEIQKEVNEGLRTLEISRLEVLDELQEVHHQKAEINKKLTSFKQVKISEFNSQNENSKHKHTDLEFQLQQEQDLLKLRLEQQMSRQSEVLAGIKEKSESTILSIRHKLNHLEDLVSSTSSNTQNLRISHSIVQRSNVTRSIDLLPLGRELHVDDGQEMENSHMDPDWKNHEQPLQDHYERHFSSKTGQFESQTGSSDGSHERRQGVFDEGALSINDLGTQEANLQRLHSAGGVLEGNGAARNKSGQLKGILKISTEEGTLQEHKKREGSISDLHGQRRKYQEVTGSESEVCECFIYL